MIKLKVGDIVQTQEDESWFVDIDPWDSNGEPFNFPTETIFEIVEINKGGVIRMWCPKHRNYVSGALDDELLHDSYMFKKISK